MRTPSQVLNINHKYFDFFSGNTNMCAISESSSIDCVVLSDCFCLFAYLTTLLRAVSVVLSVCVYVLVIQSCPTPCYPMDCGPPGSSIHGMFQARILGWIAISSSRGSSQPRDWIWVSRFAGRFFTTWATREPLMYWVIGHKKNRLLVGGFVFICLAVELCLVFVVAICTTASKSSNVLILVCSPGLEASLCIIYFLFF